MIYDPAIQYIGHRKKCVQHAPKDVELHILACAHKQEDVVAAIKLLEYSNPTKHGPLCIYGLCLEDLFCSATPLLINHQLGQTTASSNSSRSQPIIDVFRYFHRKNKRVTYVDVFTAVSPRKQMHEDVCWLEFQKACSLVMLPFHKKWNGKTKMVSQQSELRNVNLNVLERAPCSVGILIDRSTKRGLSSIFAATALYRVVVLFAGGPDDREALTYALRMVGSPRVHLTIIRFVAPRDEDGGHDRWDQMYDNEALRLIRTDMSGYYNIIYQEEVVRDGLDTAVVVKNNQNSFDLIMMGRRHDNEPKFLSGLAEWSELAELGPLGDFLASEDISSGVSVLVVQQQIMIASHGSVLNSSHDN